MLVPGRTFTTTSKPHNISGALVARGLTPPYAMMEEERERERERRAFMSCFPHVNASSLVELLPF